MISLEEKLKTRFLRPKPCEILSNTKPLELKTYKHNELVREDDEFIWILKVVKECDDSGNQEITVDIIKYYKHPTVNLKYKEELDIWNKHYEKHLKDFENWEIEQRYVVEKLRKEKEDRDRKLYEKLKAQFEPKLTLHISP